MVRSPSRCSKDGFKKGAWTADEDKMLRDYIKVHGEGKWSNVARKTGLKRCGKSCRLRWMNYLRPDIKRGNISHDEEKLILRLHKLLGNRWSLIAGRLPGRTDNEIKNYWNTNLGKRARGSQLTSFPKIERDQFSEADGLGGAHQDPVATWTTNLPPPPSPVVFSCTEGRPPSSKEPADDETTGRVRNEPGPGDRLCTVSGDDESSSGFVVDFDVDDLCKFLDTDDFADDSVHASFAAAPNGVVADEGGGPTNSWDDVDGNGNCVDLMSLASFLDAAEEWRPERE